MFALGFGPETAVQLQGDTGMAAALLGAARRDLDLPAVKAARLVMHGNILLQSAILASSR